MGIHLGQHEESSLDGPIAEYWLYVGWDPQTDGSTNPVRYAQIGVAFILINHIHVSEIHVHTYHVYEVSEAFDTKNERNIYIYFW